MKRFFLLHFMLLTFAGLYANDSTKIHSIFDEFYRPDQILEVTLQFDCKQLIRQKEKQEKMPATLTYQNSNGESVTRSIQVKSRGRSRLQVCSFPPLKLDFNKEELIQAGFLADADQLKLVTHCSNAGLTDRQVLKEWLVYKLYNIINEKSYNTQLLRIKYLDKNGALYADEYAFLIEPTEALAARIDCQKSERVIESSSELESPVYNQMLLFEYMIGNVDWDIRSRHNIAVLKSNKGGFRVAVPYDFDYSGIVSAFYAVADKRVGQKYLGERALFYAFSDEPAFQTAIQYFLAKEEAIFDACDNFTLLDEKDRAAVIKYLKSFYDLVKAPKMTTKKLNSYSIKAP